MKLKGYLLALLSAVSYGLIPLFILPIKAVQFPLETTLFYRFFISAVVVLGYLLITKKSLKLQSHEAVIMLVLGLLYALSADMLFLGYDYLTPGIASTILFVYPVFVAIIMLLLFNERLSRNTLLSIIITLSGVVVLSLKDTSFHINLLGLGVAVLSALSYATYMVVVNKSRIEISGILVTFYSMLFTAAYYLCKAIIHDVELVPSATLFFHFTVFALVTTVLSITALIYAIQLIGSTPTSIMGALEPVVAVAISVMLFHEKLTINLSIGVFLIIIGVVFNILTGTRKGNPK
jgi:drug/metabolite transporter (DMT)-like permease